MTSHSIYYLGETLKNHRIGTLLVELHKYCMRPICKVCNKNPRAPAYYRNNKRYYRSRCSSCIRSDRNIKPQEPLWKINGYKKKPTCDLCGFRSTYSSQIVVYHIDGNLKNCNLINLRSICLCCVEVVKRRHITWRIGNLEVDR